MAIRRPQPRLADWPSRYNGRRMSAAQYLAHLPGSGSEPIHCNAQPVPDTEIVAVQQSNFKSEARRQSLLAAQSPTAREDQAFVDSISEFQVN